MSTFNAKEAILVEFFKLPSKTSTEDFEGEFGVHNYFIDGLSFVIYNCEEDNCIEYYRPEPNVFQQYNESFEDFKALLDAQIKKTDSIPKELKDAEFIFGLYQTTYSEDNDIEIVYERLGDIDIEFEWGVDDLDESTYANHFGCRIWKLEADFKLEIQDGQIQTSDVNLNGETYEDIDEAFHMEEDSVKKSIAIVGKSYEEDSLSNIEKINDHSDLFYVNVGESDTRNWDDCLKYGFIAAGQNPKSSKQLASLKVGDKIVAYLKKYGFVGVGEVTEEAVNINEFLSMGIPLKHHELKAPNMFKNADNEYAEYLIKVNWISAVERNKAHWKSKSGLYTTPLIKASLKNQPKTIRFIELFFEVDLSS